MKYLIPLLTLLVAQSSWANWPLVEREAESVLATEGRLRRVSKEWDKKDLLKTLTQRGLLDELQQGKKRAKIFVQELKDIEVVQDKVRDCVDSISCEEEAVKSAVLYLRAKKQIDDVAGLILIAHIRENKKQLNWLAHRKLDLPEYLLTLEGIERSRKTRGAELLPTVLTSRKQRQKVKPWGRITARQELFLKYDLFEIKVLTQILEKTQKRISAQSISIVIDYDGNGEADETIPVAPSERYRFAHKALTLEVAQETLSQGFLPGKSVEGPHLLMASSELGYVDEKILKQLMEMPELQSAKSEKHKMYLNALWTIGKAGLMAVPGGIYFVLPIVIVESYFQGKKANEKKNAPTYF